MRTCTRAIQREGTKLASQVPNGFEDEGEFAGYVDSGIWEIEHFLGAQDRAMQHLRMAIEDHRED